MVRFDVDAYLVSPILVAVLGMTVTLAADMRRNQPERMSLDAHILKQTTVSPVDCGTHPLEGADPEALHRSLECGEDALKQHLAFKTMQRGPGIDSEIAYGLIGLRDGAVFWFDYDSRPCGGPMCAEKFDVQREWADIRAVVVVHDRQGQHRFRWLGRR